MTLGPLMLDVEGYELTAEDRELLQHPAVGGVILFTRNYDNPRQVQALVEDIHGLRDTHLLVAVDQEGGRVQRLRDGFTRLPPAQVFGNMFDEQPDAARHAAHEAGWLLAAELRAIGVDFSFAPVLDLGHGVSGVIGDRAFHARADTVATLAFAFMQGLEDGGMKAVGKHFPGHMPNRGSKVKYVLFHYKTGQGFQHTALHSCTCPGTIVHFDQIVFWFVMFGPSKVNLVRLIRLSSYIGLRSKPKPAVAACYCSSGC